MEIWIKKDAKHVLRLPILPPNFEVTKEANNNEITRYGKGPAVLMGKAGLKKISFSSFFPKQKYDFLQYKKSYRLKNKALVALSAPIDYVKKLDAWMNVPVALIITGVGRWWCTIESFNYKEQDATRDIYYDISFREYIKPTYSKPKKKPSGSGSKKPQNKNDRDTKPIKTTKYTVVKGDNLLRISKKVTGTDKNWKKIYNQNKKVIEAAAKKNGHKSSKGGNLIFPGTKLVIKV